MRVILVKLITACSGSGVRRCGAGELANLGQGEFLVAGVVDGLGQESYGRIMANQQPLGPLGPDVAVTHILVVTDPARSRDFWVDVLGAEVYREYGGTSVVLRFAGTWLLLVSGGGPTADKPTVVFQPPADTDLVSHAMTLRVADCQAAYEALRSRGAAFLTPPDDWGSEIRCFLRDPDGHLVEISQSKAS
jgi:catechol 2,3-dioxygenase-like lactoylglutathione lyase family enzyme